jgi:hypothetical protein
VERIRKLELKRQQQQQQQQQQQHATPKPSRRATTTAVLHPDSDHELAIKRSGSGEKGGDPRVGKQRSITPLQRSGSGEDSHIAATPRTNSRPFTGSLSKAPSQEEQGEEQAQEEQEAPTVVEGRSAFLSEIANMAKKGRRRSNFV